MTTPRVDPVREVTRAAPSPAAGIVGDLLSGRLQILSLARAVGFAFVTVVAALPTTDLAAAANMRTAVLIAGGLRVAIDLTVFLATRRRVGTIGGLLDATLLLDAIWFGILLEATGGLTSPYLVVVELELLAVTVLFTAWAGAKLAILGTGAMLWIAAARAGSTAPVPIGPFEVITDLDTLVAALTRGRVLFDVGVMWAVVGTTALFARFNERDLRRSNRELSVLRQLNTELESSLELSDVSQAIARGVVQDLGYARAVVWLAETPGELTPGGAQNFGPDGVERLQELRLAVGPGPVGACVESREPVLLSRDDARPAALAEAFELDSPLVLVPLVSEGRLLGLLTAEVRAPVGRPPQVRGRDVRILATLATEAALALDNARLHAELRDLSITDALTGVYNHRYFQQRLQEELDRAVRHAQDGRPTPVSLIFMDLDFFKRVNDRFGHPSGDELLRSFAKLARRVTRSSDVVCRYGGEEFGIILPEASAEQARQVAERLREAVERSSFIGADARALGAITASFGVATSGDGEPSRSDLIAEADEALYAAKDAGRNRVVVA